MKIRNKFLIPMIALILAAVMIGSAVPGAATDTTAAESAEETTHPLTYIPTTPVPTSSLEDEIGAFVSNNLGQLGEAEDEVREFGGVMSTILRAIRDFIDKLIEFFKSSFITGVIPPEATTAAPAETTAAAE